MKLLNWFNSLNNSAYRASLHARIGGDLNDIKSLKQKNKLLKGAVEKERAAKTELVKQLKELRE